MASGLSKMSLVVPCVRVLIVASGLSKTSHVVPCVRVLIVASGLSKMSLVVPCVRVLIVASGLSKLVEPNFEGREFTENYSNVSINPDDYEGKSVFIFGKSELTTIFMCMLV